MDGTIVDNMAFHTTSWLAFFERHGHALDADAFFRDTAGRQGHEIIAKYLGEGADHVTLLAEKEVVYRELYGPHLATVAGFDRLIASARQAGVGLVVGTAAPAENIAFTLDGLDLRHRFDAIVGAADVERGKPHPDVFLKGALLAGAQPHNCIVFEDAPWAWKRRAVPACASWCSPPPCRPRHLPPSTTSLPSCRISPRSTSTHCLPAWRLRWRHIINNHQRRTP